MSGEAFRDAIRAAGLTPPEAVIADGALHRFASNGNPRDDAGWYVFHADGIAAGSFGDWRTGHQETWRQSIGRKLSPVEAMELSRRAAEAKRQREADEAKRHADARERAATIWQATASASTDHAYLIAKGVQPHGCRQSGDELVIPMREASGKLHSLQTIAGDGSKRFLTGGHVRGCYFSIGKPDGVICIAEGFATAASVHEATGHAVACAFNAGNLESVARAIREKHPDVRVILCGDDDYRIPANPGRTSAHDAARAVGGVVALPDFGDDRPVGATDFNELARHRGEAVERAIASARSPDVATLPPDAWNATAVDSQGGGWPQALDPAAFHGIAGDFVRMVEPNTESDPAAILVQFLASFGALVGRGPHYRVEGDEHHANLFVLMIGATAKGRKGTSWSRVREVFERIPDWKPHASGLSSGEGLKYHVRDAIEATKPNKTGELVTEVIDEGVTDKRLLIVESEFASALRAAQRQGNTLSATIREGWDTGNLRTLTKHDPVTATGAHVCIVGHITDDELRAELTATDSANGFANRFLFVAVKRSKRLPFGGERANDAEVEAFAIRLCDLATLARTRHRIGMTADARAVWEGVYTELSEGNGGLHGAVTARAEAQVIRLALLYCLLDGADAINGPHLLAALGVWQCCDDTAKHVFGASLGDCAADEIMRRLQPAGKAGLTRTEIRDLFGRHKSAEQIGAALELLRRRGRATCEPVGTGGRPVEVWRATK